LIFTVSIQIERKQQGQSALVDRPIVFILSSYSLFIMKVSIELEAIKRQKGE
jgi:hypothetical protein